MKETNETVAKKVKEPSREMLIKIKQSLPVNFYAVHARRKNEGANDSVLMFPLSDLEAYRNTFVKKYESNFGDAFIFENLCVLSNSPDHFCPQLFWDRILKFMWAK